MKQYITTEELSQRLQVTRQTLNNWRKQGLPFIKIGRAVRFDMDEVNKWIEEQNSEASEGR